jgi:protein phosphatase
MSQTKPQVYCPNPHCTAPLNNWGDVVCTACQSPLVYRYFWAVGQAAEQAAVGTQMAGRYYVAAPQIWLDTQPSLRPEVPDEWSEAVLPYLFLYPQRLHVPEVYGFCPQAVAAHEPELAPLESELLEPKLLEPELLESESLKPESLEPESLVYPTFLLENVPIDSSGNLLPSIAQVWEQTSAVRQVYWLWQLLQLWQPLSQQGVAASLLVASNLRVEGWRVRLCQLYQDAEVLPPEVTLSLSELGEAWAGWVATAKPEVSSGLQAIVGQMQTGAADLSATSAKLNQLLLAQAAQLPLRLKIAGGTDTGPQRSHNEDTCYPLTLNSATPNNSTSTEGIVPRVAIVCDGIGGHEGGEVASQMAVQSLTLQVQALLTEIKQQEELADPDLLAEQLTAIVRVVNNLVAAQNDTQGREDRRRMGTTLMMAVQLPQPIHLADNSIAENGHELYLVNVGDSRAYWITPRYCQQLTVDDDVAARETRLGRSLYREALVRPDCGALTQAIGTRDSQYLNPTVQRFILEEDGVLLLCSDGLSDNGLVEQSWQQYGPDVVSGKLALEDAIQAWIDLANRRNGYDNTSIVLLHCHVSSASPGVALPKTSPGRDVEWSASSKALFEEADHPAPVLSNVARSVRSGVLIGLLLLLVGGGAGLWAWSQIDPPGFQHLRDRVLPKP